MNQPIKAAAIYYSAAGNVHRLAEAARGGEKAGSETRLRKVGELAPEAAIDGNDAWRKHIDETGYVETAEVGALGVLPRQGG
jgi:NAD(P)H dehydrogenase (quinone)